MAAHAPRVHAAPALRPPCTLPARAPLAALAPLLAWHPDCVSHVRVGPCCLPGAARRTGVHPGCGLRQRLRRGGVAARVGHPWAWEEGAAQVAESWTCANPRLRTAMQLPPGNGVSAPKACLQVEQRRGPQRHVALCGSGGRGTSSRAAGKHASAHASGHRLCTPLPALTLRCGTSCQHKTCGSITVSSPFQAPTKHPCRQPRRAAAHPTAG